jgi:GNAT superfamily N-acetyltransferase
MNHEWHQGGYTVSTDPQRLDLKTIHGFLTKAYWSPGIPMEIVKRSIDNAIPFGIYQGDRLVGFGRVITDRATFGYIADVFVLEEHRGHGLSKWLVECMLAHP